MNDPDEMPPQEPYILVGDIWRHADGGEYKVLHLGEMKSHETGVWVNSVTYTEAGRIYTRSVASFRERFELTTTGVFRRLSSVAIEDVGFSTRTRNVLISLIEREGGKDFSLAAVACFYPGKLLRQGNFGQVSLKEVRDTLNAHLGPENKDRWGDGFRWKGDTQLIEQMRRLLGFDPDVKDRAEYAAWRAAYLGPQNKDKIDGPGMVQE